jgi:hypothetical protein
MIMIVWLGIVKMVAGKELAKRERCLHPTTSDAVNQ